MKDIKDQMVQKSIEAFLLGLEVYNKPTIKYRIEGFSFFIINAWELMLKAELINRGISIYYKDKPDRSLSISDTIKRIYSDKYTRIRLNLEKIIDLRNISTHFITEEYETKYAPLFQACVLNFVNEIKRFHDEDITDYVSQNFLTLSVSYAPLSNEQILMKYPPEIAEKLIQKGNDIDVSTEMYASDKFALSVKQNLYITKKRSEADFVVSIAPGSDNRVAKVKELKDPSDTHKYSYNNVISAVQEGLKKRSIKLGYKSGFNSFVLNQVIEFYNAKAEPKFAYRHKIGNQTQYTYSQQFVDFIIEEISRDPAKFVDSIRKGNKKR